MSAETQYGFDFGPMKVTRAVGDPRYGYSVRIEVGSETYEVSCTPAGRRSTVTRHVGNNVWEELS